MNHAKQPRRRFLSAAAAGMGCRPRRHAGGLGSQRRQSAT